jgi:hypothetical protein
MAFWFWGLVTGLFGRSSVWIGSDDPGVELTLPLTLALISKRQFVAIVLVAFMQQAIQESYLYVSRMMESR